jgi:hypothetical protein
MTLGPTAWAYATAAMILCVGVLAAWTWHRPPAGASDILGEARADAAGPGQESPIVGTISQVVDCRSADRTAVPAKGAPVRVGRKFALSAGRLEITYRASAQARVVLQAPITYEVTSESGGLLSLGVATVHSMQRATGARVGMHPFVEGTLFSVSTPTEVFVDRGGQFSVLVDRAGHTRARLMGGFVEVQFPAATTTDDPRFWPDHASWAYVQPGAGKQITRAIFGAGTPPLIAAILTKPGDRRTASATAPLRLEQRPGNN